MIKKTGYIKILIVAFSFSVLSSCAFLTALDSATSPTNTNTDQKKETGKTTTDTTTKKKTTGKTTTGGGGIEVQVQ